jgi:hypothetical protein
MPADKTGTSNSHHYHFAQYSDDESTEAIDNVHEAIGEQNATQKYASIRPVDEQTHNNTGLRPSMDARSPVFIPLETPEKKREEVITWMSLPHKKQLAVLTLARLSEPLVQSSLQSYMFYQLKSFDQSLPDSVIASQAGFMKSSFTAAQFLTAVMWGRIADSDRSGRKTVLIVGLVGTCKC